MGGYISISEISFEINQITASEKNSKLLLLKDLFHIGQFVRVIVLSIDKEKRSIKLTMRPDRLNEKVVFSSRQMGTEVYGSIHEKRENDYIVHLGKQGYSGFLPQSNIPKELSKK